MMNTNSDYLILGAGPAGLQLGYFLGKNGRDYLILERESEPGTFFNIFPRHSKLLSINKVYTGTEDPEENLRWDWNSLLSDSEEMLFKHYSKEYYPEADDLRRYLVDFAHHFDLRIKYDTAVAKVSKKEGKFILTDAEGNTFTGKRLVVATGFGKVYMPAVPGIELCENYSNHSIDLEDYKNKRVLVVGKGNSGFETANHLGQTAAVVHMCSPESIEFAWQSHYVGHLRAVNDHFLDTYQLKSQNAVLDAEINRIERQGDRLQVTITYCHAMGQTAVLSYDHVIFCTGFGFSDAIFDDSCSPELVILDLLPAQTSEWESPNVPDMYFAGTLMAACDFKKTMSAFIHGYRHNIQMMSHVFEQKYHDVPWPSQSLMMTPEAVLDKVIERATTGPGIFLQPGFLSDVIVVSEQGSTAEYYEDIRTDYIPNSAFSGNEHYYTISLQYGHFGGDPFSVARDPDPAKAAKAPYLHPIIRRYNRDTMVAEHHIQDDLENAWYKDTYVQPALAFFRTQLVSEVNPA